MLARMFSGESYAVGGPKTTETIRRVLYLIQVDYLFDVIIYQVINRFFDLDLICIRNVTLKLVFTVF